MHGHCCDRKTSYLMHQTEIALTCAGERHRHDSSWTADSSCARAGPMNQARRACSRPQRSPARRSRLSPARSWLGEVGATLAPCHLPGMIQTLARPVGLAPRSPVAIEHETGVAARGAGRRRPPQSTIREGAGGERRRAQGGGHAGAAGRSRIAAGQLKPPGQWCYRCSLQVPGPSTLGHRPCLSGLARLSGEASLVPIARQTSPF